MRHAELAKLTKTEYKKYLRRRKAYYYATHEAYLKRKRDGYRRRKAAKKKAAKQLAQAAIGESQTSAKKIGLVK
jgi:hypothetical protein